MAVGIGMVGRNVTATFGGVALKGVVTKGGDRTNTRLDTTDDLASGWSESMAISGLKAVTLPISGVLKNLELMQSYYQTSQMFNVVFTYEDGSTETGDFFLDNFSITGESNGLFSFDAAFSSSGAVAFVAGS